MFTWLLNLFRRKPRTILSQIRGRVLVVLAHPDDEIHVAHIIDSIPKSSNIVLYVACYGQDRTRSTEMLQAANRLGCKLIHDNLTDPVYPVNRIMQMIHDQMPDWIITLDPTHGNYGEHHQHKAITDAAIEAVKRTRFMPARVVFATQIVRVPLEVYGRFDNSIPMGKDPQIYFEPTPGHEVHDVRSRWTLLGDLMKIHKSQFSDREIDLLNRARADRRKISLQTMDIFWR